MEEEVEVYTEVTKIGKNVVFSECHIYTDPNGARKLSSKGSHIKSVMKENWDYVVPWLESQSKVAWLFIINLDSERFIWCFFALLYKITIKTKESHYLVKI